MSDLAMEDPNFADFLYSKGFYITKLHYAFNDFVIWMFNYINTVELFRSECLFNKK